MADGERQQAAAGRTGGLSPAALVEAGRQEVDPPIQVEAATWSKAGQLDWWVKERQEWWGTYAIQTAVNGGSELLIFVPPKKVASPQSA